MGGEQEMRIYDVSLPLSARLPTWPGDPEFEFTPIVGPSAPEQAQVSSLRLGTHSGTHIDAPRHLFPDGASVAQIPLGSLVGDAWVCRLPSDLPLVTARALEGASIPGGTRRLLLGTGNGLIWDRPYHAFTQKYVALSPDGADWIVARGIVLVGIDYLSVDPFDAPGLPAHRTLLGNGVVVIEGLDLRRVAAGHYRLCCLPLRIEGADGAPARVVLLRSR
jgi:arylformamidase